MKSFIFFVFMTCAMMRAFGSDPKEIDKKIQAFDHFLLEKKKSSDEREGALNEFLETQKGRDKLRQEQLEKHLVEKSKIKKVKPEDTPEFKNFIETKVNQIEMREVAEEKNLKELEIRKPTLKEKLFEVREHGLEDTEKNRVAAKARKIRGGGRSSGGSSGGYSGGADDYRDNSFNSPPPPPPMEEVPEFDNEIPPPPPPPPMPGDMNFEDRNSQPVPPESMEPMAPQD